VGKALDEPQLFEILAVIDAERALLIWFGGVGAGRGHSLSEGAEKVTFSCLTLCVMNTQNEEDTRKMQLRQSCTMCDTR
jgi:hypothetical protein